jgi:hypothetical protein
MAEASKLFTFTSIERGHSSFNARCLSVVSHPFALLLVFVLNGKEINDLIRDFGSDEPYLLANLRTTVDCSGIVADVFRESLIKNGHWTEPQITDWIMEQLKTLRALPFEVTGSKMMKRDIDRQRYYKPTAPGFIFMLKNYTTKNQSYSPLMIMKIGMDHSHWWEKFDQCTRYLEMMSTPTENSEICFDTPQLMAIATINSENFTVLMALFLFHPKIGNREFGMTLLWHSNGSFELFGKLFNDASKFQCLVQNHQESKTQLTHLFGYKYYSSNCCRIHDKVCINFITTTFYKFCSNFGLLQINNGS